MKMATNHEIEPINIQTLLSYIEFAENYNLSTILPLAVNLCARYDLAVLKEAEVEDRVSEKTWKEIVADRNSLMTTFMRKILQRGIFFTINVFFFPSLSLQSFIYFFISKSKTPLYELQKEHINLFQK